MWRFMQILVYSSYGATYSWSPRLRPSKIRAFFKTSFNESTTDISAAGASSTSSTCSVGLGQDMHVSDYRNGFWVTVRCRRKRIYLLLSLYVHLFVFFGHIVQLRPRVKLCFWIIVVVSLDTKVPMGWWADNSFVAVQNYWLPIWVDRTTGRSPQKITAELKLIRSASTT